MIESNRDRISGSLAVVAAIWMWLATPVFYKARWPYPWEMDAAYLIGFPCVVLGLLAFILASTWWVRWFSAAVFIAATVLSIWIVFSANRGF